MSASLITPVIICGGTGTRLWPLSRESQPKQFIPFGGGLSTFRQALNRITEPGLFARPIVVTNIEFRFTVADQLQSSGVSADIVLEPAGRDSGPAIAVAAEFASRRDREALLLVLAADHIVRDTNGFRRACEDALEPAAAGHLVTFGVHPNAPMTSYGYIRPGAKLAGSLAHVIEAFVEKPDQETAKRYVAEGYLWNSGNFLFRADRMLDELGLFEPEMLAAAKVSVDALTQDLDFLRLPMKHSCGRRKNPSTMRSWNIQLTLPCCPSTSAGQTLEIGAHCGRSSITTRRAMQSMVRPP